MPIDWWEQSLRAAIVLSVLLFGAYAISANHKAKKHHVARMLSLWLVPPEPARSQIREQMARVAQSQGLPMFEPHVTLLGDVGGGSDRDIRRKLEALQGSGPVTVTFEAAVASGHVPGELTPWYQAAVAPVRETEALRRLQRKARRAFLGKPEAEPIVSWAPPLGKPHLSLAYAESTRSYNRSAKACDVLMTPDSFVATEVAVAQVSDQRDMASVWAALIRNDWSVVARVSL